MNKNDKRKQQEEYRILMEKKKRRLQKNRTRQSQAQPQKALVKEAAIRKKKQKKNEKKRRISQNLGVILVIVQLVISIIFIGVVLRLNILPFKYVAIIGILLLLLLIGVFVSQIRSKKKCISGKVASIFFSIILLFGSYYIVKSNSALFDITGGNKKVDSIVVAVKTKDAAKKLQDAKDYTFGVQYAMGGDNIEAAVNTINKELGTDVNTKECESIGKQADELFAGKVEAIVYNSAYTAMLEEEIEGFSDKTRIIYTHKIETEVDNEGNGIKVQKEPFSVFISGIDVYGDITTNSRSDVNIIATVNPKTHQVLLITTPRDYYVPIPGISGDKKDKLTHAGIYGVDASMATLGQVYDMGIDFYARINFTSLIDIVNALGGVDVESEYAFTTSKDSGVVMDVKKGMNTFNGEQALAFSRERQNLADGDNQRGKDQQAVIKGLINKMISPSALMGANKLIDSVRGNVDTNMAAKQIQSLIKQQLSEQSPWNIYSVAAEGTGDKQYCYSYKGKPLYVCQPDQTSVDKIKGLVDAVENGETLPAE
ncbi:MAG: LCP family protein [Lachnospiraceae bacterium]